MRIEDFSVPDSLTSRGAENMAREYYSAGLYAHVMRSWLFAEGFAALEHRDGVDRELLYVAAMLHDIGLVAAFDNVALPYEDAGGHAAVALAFGAGWTKARRGRLLDVVVRHNCDHVDPEFDMEGYLLETATGLDVSGKRAGELPGSFIYEVLGRYPREGFGNEFLGLVRGQSIRKPDSAAHRMMDNGLERKLTREHPLDS
ncbi:MAG: HD domain-containing protein [Bifidobacterium psychraerophilum]|uniref:HD domain-containing protein n=1 Tax=Bifidobacterium psychraerophilum TaxID=218140 RepID=UPI0039E7958D